MCTTLSGTIQIEWFDVIVTIVTGYLGDRRLVVPLILPRTWTQATHVHVHCTTCICQHDAQERVAVYTGQVLPVSMRSLGARILPCACVRLDPGHMHARRPTTRSRTGYTGQVLPVSMRPLGARL